MKTACALLIVALWTLPPARAEEPKLPYAIVDTGQERSYDNRTEITCRKPGQAFFGQDANYAGNQPAYRDNGDGTVTDLKTGLMWQADPGEKKTVAQAVAGAGKCRTGGHDDWRLPTIKELYSLILFTGTDPDPSSTDTSKQTPFIDTRYFKFRYGDPADGDRVIDSQWATSTLYVGRVMQHARAMFGVNFADGRIKGYPADANPRGRTKKFYVIYCRGNSKYGKNDFHDNGDGTVTDRATGLTWMQLDSAALKAGPRHDGKLNWQEALAWAEDLTYAGRSDWRLPNAKELQSILDYSRSPDTTHSAAIDPVFKATAIHNEGGQTDYGYYWTGTTHTRLTSAGSGVYIAFGRALGYMSDPHGGGGEKTLMDVHGAGAQRCDAKSGDPSRLPKGRGPQGDVMRIYNLVRCVRGGAAEPRTTGPAVEMKYAARGPEPLDAGGPSSAPDGRRPPTGEDFVRRLDRNGDGKVSRDEFDGPKENFRDFDRNSDGYITPDEAPTGPPSGSRPPLGPRPQ